MTHTVEGAESPTFLACLMARKLNRKSSQNRGMGECHIPYN
jgi:hypothetical protein